MEGEFPIANDPKPKRFRLSSNFHVETATGNQRLSPWCESPTNYSKTGSSGRFMAESTDGSALAFVRCGGVVRRPGDANLGSALFKAADEALPSPFREAAT